MPKVEIYYSQMCGLCHEAMEYFDKKDVAYKSYEVFWKNNELVDDENSRMLISRCGKVDFVPQIFINDKHISGWKTLSRLIETEKLDELLKD